MLVLLKIPLVYLCMVVWWAIRAEPTDEQQTVGVRVTDTPPPHAGWSRSTGGRDAGGRRGARGPSRAGRRETRARAAGGR